LIVVIEGREHLLRLRLGKAEFREVYGPSKACGELSILLDEFSQFHVQSPR